MAGPGRPRASRPTRGVKMFEDTAEKLGWILQLEGKGEKFADFIEDAIRPVVESRYAPFEDLVRTIKAAQAGNAPAAAPSGGQ